MSQGSTKSLDSTDDLCKVGNGCHNIDPIILESSSSEESDKLSSASVTSFGLTQKRTNVSEVIRTGHHNTQDDNTIGNGRSLELVTASTETGRTVSNTNYAIQARNHTLHIPEFYNSILYSNQSDNEKVKMFRNKEEEWVTPSLEEEMSQYYPKACDMKRDQLTNDVIMNKEQFSLNFRQMFPLNVYLLITYN